MGRVRYLGKALLLNYRTGDPDPWTARRVKLFYYFGLFAGNFDMLLCISGGFAGR